MLYQAYQTYADASEPMRMLARTAMAFTDFLPGFNDLNTGRTLSAWLEMTARTRITHTRPSYEIDTVRVGRKDVGVREEIVLSLPFCDLLRFSRDDAPDLPKMLVIAPLSGHFSTLLRKTVRTLLRDHDVYIADWKNARDIPLSEGAFGFDDYIEYVITFIEEIGPESHLLAVCQPCVQAIAAVALMAADNHPAQPRSMSLMAGPIDTRIAPTEVNELATSRPIEWFEQNLIATVPYQFDGFGRSVYPGFIQLCAFMSMNLDKHTEAHRNLFNHLAGGCDEEAEAIKTFYDEYCAVLDLPAEFYIETVRKVFQEALLAKGELTYRGNPVEPAAIRRTALLTIEGERDDICSVGQTAAAHDLCTGLRPHLKRHHLQAGVGHYGTFSGKRWDREIAPVIRNMVLATS